MNESRRSILAAQWMLGIGLMATWEGLARAELLDPFFFSRPSDVASRLVRWLVEGSVWSHLAVTGLEALLAFLIGAGGGMLFGFALAQMPRTALVLEPYVHVLNALPRVVLAPVFLLWFGLGIWSKVALGVTLVFFVVFFNTYRGVRDVDQRLVDNARLLGASRAQLARHVLLPSALSWIFASLHLSIGFAIVGAVVGEYLGAARGIGYLIAQAEGVFDTTGVLAGIVLLSALVLAVTRIVVRVERWLLRWQPNRHEEHERMSHEGHEDHEVKEVKKRTFVSFVIFVACFFVAFVATACGAGPSELTRVRIAVGGQPQLIYLPITLADRLGYYRDERLQVEIQDFPGGARALQSLLGGSADVVCGYYDHTVQMAAEGRALVAFVSMLRYPVMMAIVAPQPRKAIKAMEDLEGAIVGVTSPGSATHFFLNYLLARAGLRSDDVSVTGIGTSASAVAAVERSQVDAGIVVEPTFTQLSRRIPGLRVLADTRTAEGVKTTFGVDVYPAAVLYAPEAWLTSHRNTAARLARAIVRTLDWIRSHPPEEVAGQVPEFVGTDRAAYLEALGNTLPAYSEDGRLDEKGAEAAKRVLALSIERVRTTPIDLRRTFTNELLENPAR